MTVSRPDVPLTDGVVVLRTPTFDDVPRIVEACLDPEVVHWTQVPSGYTERMGRDFVQAALDGQLDDDEILFTIVEAGAEDRLLGVIGVRPDEGELHAELGYWSHPQGRRRGVMTRAVAIATDWCLGPLALHRVTATTSVRNTASQAVLRRNGFRCEATLREHLKVDGEFHDAHVYGRLPGDPPEDRPESQLEPLPEEC